MLNTKQILYNLYTVQTIEDTIKIIDYNIEKNTLIVQHQSIMTTKPIPINNEVYIEYAENPAIYSIK